jgi:hypothetical protein
MYVNGKMIPVETSPRMEERRIKENHKRSGLHCKNFCKCHNVPPPHTTIFKKENQFLKK